MDLQEESLNGIGQSCNDPVYCMVPIIIIIIIGNQTIFLYN